MGVTYTADQQKVIDTRGKNILVSAAAGSGKTAVLVERIVQLVCDEKHPVDIDRLLIVTFTNAAASEMRERISNVLSGRLQSRPGNEHLQRQLTLLHNAQITTIDSFCLFVIRNNFNDIGLDPGFRVADEGELKLLKKEVMDRMLEEYYAAGDEEYLYCLESFSVNGSEKPLADQIDRLCTFAGSYPWPEEWLQHAADAYMASGSAPGASDDGREKHRPGKDATSAWLTFAGQDVRQTVAGCRQRLEEALRLCEESDGPYMYGELLEKECEMLSRVEKEEDFGILGECLGGVAFGRLSSKKDDTVSTEKRERAKYMRSQVKDALQKLRERYYFLPDDIIVTDLAESGRIVRKMVSMTLDFMERFRRKKQEKNLIDFGDMEHYALDILLEKTEEGYRPSRAARDYRDYFYEILIDEYQDSNLVQEYLLQSISGEAAGNHNRFMVGDVKQSIYKFRLARPEIFMEKLKSYTERDEKKLRIILKQNFRSRRQVLDCVNAVFGRLMREDFGGIEYDDDAALYPGADYPEYDSCKEQLILLQKDPESKCSKTEQEAELAALQIEKLMDGHQVTDKGTGKLRNVRYGDIAILVRTNAGWEDALRKALKRHGIPAHSGSSTGYFSSEEIRRVMSFLRILDNPLQDIPLYGVLVSPMGGFTEEEIARIRAGYKQVSLYDALISWHSGTECLSDGDGMLRHKADAFLRLYDKLRSKVSNTPVRRLIREILEETGYYQYISAFPDGVKRRGNLEMLLKKAADFERTSYYGLFHFIRYMEQLEKYDVDYGEANVLDENADVVRIMSIHKSKGLEFPVCIVAGLSKRFNIRDEAGMFQADIDLGIGCDKVDPVHRIRRTTLYRNILARKQRLDNLGEELRILYVAMTRAREKLILTACVDDIDRKLAECMADVGSRGDKLSYLTLQDAGCMLDFLLPAWISGQRECSCMELIQVHPGDIAGGEFQTDIRANLRRERLLSGGYPVDGRMAEGMRHRLSAEYPHKNLEQLYTKTTVSELKLERMVELSEPVNQMFDTQIQKAYVPRFAGQMQEMSGSSRGSAYHRVMELLRLDTVSRGEIAAQMKEFVAAGKMPEEYMTCVSESKLMEFLNTPEAQRMREADERGLLYREQPFVLGLPAREVKEEFPEGETVLIQGIIDVFWEESGGVTVLDYKTDRVDSAQELVRRYQTQLDWYGEALTRMTGKPVTQKLIYSFCLNEIIRL